MWSIFVLAYLQQYDCWHAHALVHNMYMFTCVYVYMLNKNNLALLKKVQPNQEYCLELEMACKNKG